MSSDRRTQCDTVLLTADAVVVHATAYRLRVQAWHRNRSSLSCRNPCSTRIQVPNSPPFWYKVG